MGTEIVAQNAAALAAPLAAGQGEPFIFLFTVFVLAVFVGFYVVWSVTPALHSPLMSVTNAISSIIVLGAILQISSGEKVIMWVAVFAVLITSINIVGGFAVTRRMLEMFRK